MKFIQERSNKHNFIVWS